MQAGRRCTKPVITVASASFVNCCAPAPTRTLRDSTTTRRCMTLPSTDTPRSLIYHYTHRQTHRERERERDTHTQRHTEPRVPPARSSLSTHSAFCDLTDLLFPFSCRWMRRNTSMFCRQSLRCFDSVGWVTGRASSMYKPRTTPTTANGSSLSHLPGLP